MKHIWNLESNEQSVGNAVKPANSIATGRDFKWIRETLTISTSKCLEFRL